MKRDLSNDEMSKELENLDHSIQLSAVAKKKK